MKRHMQFIFIALFAGTLLALISAGCQTAHGFGEDMENAGEEIQEGTQ